MFGKRNRQRIERLENTVRHLESKNKALQEKLDEKRRLHNPNWRKEIIVSPYVFDKYVRNSGHPVVGGYHLPCGDGTYYIVRIDESMSNGYIRYEEAFEEPYSECKKCGDAFKQIMGYPNNNPDFCSYECYKEFLSNNKN
ncbi:hypothetical protein CN446_14980 [Bacillus cereus]|nr:hypothetical protein CN446_14980 [Bacillus cereus]